MLSLYTTNGVTNLMIQLDGRIYSYAQTAYPTDGRCHHVAVTKVAATNGLKFYLDGQLTHTASTVLNARNGGNLYVGGDSSGEFFNGLMGSYGYGTLPTPMPKSGAT